MDKPEKSALGSRESLWWPALGIAGALGLVYLIRACVGDHSPPNQVPIIEHGVINEKRIEEIAREEACLESLKKGERPFDCEKYDYTRKPR